MTTPAERAERAEWAKVAGGNSADTESCEGHPPAALDTKEVDHA